MVVVVAGAYFGLRVHRSIGFQTDLMALLPQEERDPEIQRAKDQVARSFGQRIVLLIGHNDRDKARAAGAEMARALAGSGLVASVTSTVPADGLRRLGQEIFPLRHGLLADGDRQRLQDGKELEIVRRALSAIYGLVGMSDASLLTRDPFLLLPAYFASLPLPLSRVTADEGALSVRDGERTYMFISAQLLGQAFSLRDQDRFAAFFDEVERRLKDQVPGLEVLRAGAVFYAREAARQALDESSAIGTLSLIGTVLLIVAVFGAVRPLWLSVLVIAVGVLCAFSASLWLFGELHVAALLFGTSLIGISVDYSLNYCAQRFTPDTAPARERLRCVMAGLVLGVATTLIGYLTLLLTPFPGLHQLAVFSAIGVCASFITVVTWLPQLDGDGALRRPEGLLRVLGHLLSFWEQPGRRRQHLAVFALCIVIAIAGFARLKADDDVRRLQPLSSELRRQELAIQRLTGVSGGTQFLLVQAEGTQAALQTEERLLPLLEKARRSGAISGFQATAQFVPSIARQQENRSLVRERLRPLLPAYYQQLGIIDRTPEPNETEGFVTTSLLQDDSPLGFARNLILEESDARSTHLVLLTSVSRPEEIRRLADGLPGTSYVDPTAEVTSLLGTYRHRAVALLGLSVLLMLPLMLWRYGRAGGLRVMLPSIASVALAPALIALCGGTFTCFNALALVLVLAIGSDYAVFYRETSRAGKLVTMLGVCLAMLTTLLSFGLLGLSNVLGVQAFGSTMLVGILLAFLFAPLAGDSGPRNSSLLKHLGR
jgi:predicted exporter